MLSTREIEWGEWVRMVKETGGLKIWGLGDDDEIGGEILGTWGRLGGLIHHL